MELKGAPLIVREDIRLLLADGVLTLANKSSHGIQCSDPADLLQVLEAMVDVQHDLPPDAKPLVLELVRSGFIGPAEQSHAFPSDFLVSAVSLLTQELDQVLTMASAVSAPERQRTALTIARAALGLRPQSGREAPLPPPPVVNGPLRLNIGCGRQRCEGWLAADLDSSADWVLDVGNPWPVATGTADAIYLSHVLEHLDRIRVVTALAEARRVLAQGRYLRVVVPNAHSWLKAYVEDDDSFFEAVYEAWNITPRTSRLDAVMTYLGGVGAAERWFSHRTCLDYETLTQLLRGAGFQNVRLMAYGKCSDPCHSAPEALIEIARRIGKPDSLSLFIDAW